MKLNALKHRLKIDKKATVDMVTFRVNPDVERFIEKEKKAGRLEVTLAEHTDNYLDLKVVKKPKKDADQD